MIELIMAEIRNLYGPDEEGNYILNCSTVVKEQIIHDLLRKGFNISVHVNGKEYDPKEVLITEIQTPFNQKIKMITNMEQGYKIEKI